MRRWLCVMVTVALVPLAAFACGDDKKTISTNDGDLTVGEKLPDGWPDDFPVYPDADLRGGIRQTIEGAEVLVATWETGDGIDDVKAFYEDELKDGAWRSTTTTALADSLLLGVENTGDDRAGQLIISEQDGKTAIVVTLGEGVGTGADTPDDAAATPDASGAGDGDLPEEVDLPDGYPDDRVPLPDDIRITTASSVTVSGAETFIVQFYSQDSTDDLAAFFKDELESNGFTQTVQQSQDGVIYAIYSENEDGSGAIVSVTIIDGDFEGYRQVSLQITNI